MTNKLSVNPSLNSGCAFVLPFYHIYERGVTYLKDNLEMKFKEVVSCPQDYVEEHSLLVYFRPPVRGIPDGCTNPHWE